MAVVRLTKDGEERFVDDETQAELHATLTDEGWEAEDASDVGEAGDAALGGEGAGDDGNGDAEGEDTSADTRPAGRRRKRDT